MKTRLGTRTGQKTLEEESKQHLNTKMCSEPQGRISMMWALAQRPLGDDKAHPFRPFRKRMHLDSNPNHP